MRNTTSLLSAFLISFNLLAKGGDEIRSQNVNGEKSSEIRDCLDQKIISRKYSYDFIDPSADPSKCMLNQNAFLAERTSILRHLQNNIPKSLYNFSSYIRGWSPSPKNQRRPIDTKDYINAQGVKVERGGYHIKESDEEKMFSELLRLKNINHLVRSYMFVNRKPFDLISEIDPSICPKGIVDGIKIKAKQQREIFDSKRIKLRENFKMSFGFKIDVIDAAKELKELISKYNYYMEESKCRTTGIDLTTGSAITFCVSRDKEKARKISSKIKLKLQKYPSLLLDRKTGFWSSDKIWEDQPWIDKVANFGPEGKEITNFIRLADKKMKKKILDTIHSFCMTPQEEKAKRLNSPDRELKLKSFKSHELVSMKSAVDSLLKEFPDKLYKFKDISSCFSKSTDLEKSRRNWKVVGVGIGCGVLAGALAYSGVGAPLVGPFVGVCTTADISIALDNYNYFEETYTKVEKCSKSGPCSLKGYEEAIQNYNSALNDIYYSVGAVSLDGAITFGGAYFRKLKYLKQKSKLLEAELKSVPVEILDQINASVKRIEKLSVSQRVNAFEQLTHQLSEIKKLLGVRHLDPLTLEPHALKMISDYFELPQGEVLRILKQRAPGSEGDIFSYLKRKSDDYKSYSENFNHFINNEVQDRLVRLDATESEVVEALRQVNLYTEKDEAFKLANSFLGGNKSYEEVLLDSSRGLAERYGHAIEVNSLAKILRDHPVHAEKIIDLMRNGTDAQKQFIKDLYTGKPKNYSQAYMKRYMNYITGNPENTVARVSSYDDSMIVVDNNVYGDLLPGQDISRSHVIDAHIDGRRIVSPPSVFREETNLSSRMDGLLSTHHGEESFEQTIRKLDEMGIGEGSSARYTIDESGRTLVKDGLYDQRAMAEVLHSSTPGGPIPTFLTSDQGFLRPYLEERLYREIVENRNFRTMLYGSEAVPRNMTKADWLSRIRDCLMNGCRGSAYPLRGNQARSWSEAFGGRRVAEREFNVMLDDIIKRDMMNAGMTRAEIHSKLVIREGNSMTRYPCGILVRVNGLLMKLITMGQDDHEFISNRCK